MGACVECFLPLATSGGTYLPWLLVVEDGVLFMVLAASLAATGCGCFEVVACLFQVACLLACLLWLLLLATSY